MLSLDDVKAAAAAAMVAEGIPGAPTIQMMGDLIEHTGEVPVRKRTHHAWLHPTKGWRGFARPRKTNRRRKLITCGALQCPGSHEFNRMQASGGRWPKMR